MFVVGLAATGYALLRLPVDFFRNGLSPNAERRFAHPALHLGWCVARNLLGAALVVAGIIMLVTPGQGLLTLVVGLMLVDFPGKRRLSLYLIRRGHLIEGANRWRARYDKPPFAAPHDDTPGSGPTTDAEAPSA